MYVKLSHTLIFMVIVVIGWSQNVSQFNIENLMKAENEAGFQITQTHYNTWERIQKTINRKVDFPNSPTRQEAIQICDSISKILERDLHFTYEISFVLSRSFPDTTLDCNLYSMVFYDILNKQHDYEVYPVVTPGHMFIRWHYTGDRYFNYETTEQKTRADSSYISLFGVSKQALENGLYMKKLNDRELWATCYSEMANAHPDTAYKARKQLCDQSLALDSHCVFAQITKGLSYARQEQYDSSLTYFHQLLSLDTSNYSIANSIGEVYSMKEEHKKAIHYYERAISLNPNAPQLYIDRSYEYLRVDSVENAMKDFELATAQLNKDNIYEFLFNYQHLRQLEQEIMETYVDRYSK